MNTTREFNLQNWTGEVVTVDYSDDGSFEFQGDKFRVGALDHEGAEMVGDGEGWRELHGEGWSDPLTTLFFVDEPGNNLEYAVIKAVRYVATYV